MKNEFEANCIEFLDERVEGWKVWGFDELFAQMLDVFDFERLDYSKRTITADRLVSILDDEREKMRRIDEWNAKQK